MSAPRVVYLRSSRKPWVALDVRLSPDDIKRIEAAVHVEAVAGTRYDAHQMSILDSERKS